MLLTSSDFSNTIRCSEKNVDRATNRNLAEKCLKQIASWEPPASWLPVKLKIYKGPEAKNRQRGEVELRNTIWLVNRDQKWELYIKGPGKHFRTWSEMSLNLLQLLHPLSIESLFEKSKWDKHLSECLILKHLVCQLWLNRFCHFAAQCSRFDQKTTLKKIL